MTYNNMKTKEAIQKEIKPAGFCIVRPELASKGIVTLGSVIVGGREIDSFSDKRPLLYRWLKDDEGFQVFYHHNWCDAESIDFNFLDDEKAIIKAHFNGYEFGNAMIEIEDWSAKDLKFLLNKCGYKSWTKDIMVMMVRDLTRIHAFKIKLEHHNAFLVKQKCK